MATKRKCQTGRVRPVLVEDFDPPVKLFVRTTFGRLVKFGEEMRAIPEGDDSASLSIMQAFLEEAIVGWEGVEDEDGNPRVFSAEAISELELEDVMCFINALQGQGEAGDGNPLVEQASEASSVEPPAS